MSTLELGISQKELREQVIERASDKIMEACLEDFDTGALMRPVREVLQKQVDAAVGKIARETIAPLVEGRIEDVVFQQTNEWGEKRGQPTTFREYLIQRAEAYLVEPVNYEGKSRSEVRDSYGFKVTGTRVASMVDQRLHREIESAMKAAMENANSQIAKGIHETVRIKLNEIAAQLNKKAAQGNQ